MESKLQERLKDDNHIIGEINNAEEVLYVKDAEQQEMEMMQVNAPNLDALLDDHTPELYDILLNAELMLPHGDQMNRGQVVKWAKDNRGRLIGKRNDNPLLNLREYEVKMRDGSTGQYTANVKAEQVDEEGWQYALLSEITDHRRMCLHCPRMKGSQCPITGGVCQRLLLADGRSKLSGRMVPRTGYQ